VTMKAPPSFGGFHLHSGSDYVGCDGPRVEVPALEHQYLVREAERNGCTWLASLRHSHPMCVVGFNSADYLMEEIDRLLEDPTVDDRGRAAALWIAELLGRTGTAGRPITACNVGSEPYEEPRWK